MLGKRVRQLASWAASFLCTHPGTLSGVGQTLLTGCRECWASFPQRLRLPGGLPRVQQSQIGTSACRTSRSSFAGHLLHLSAVHCCPRAAGVPQAAGSPGQLPGRPEKRHSATVHGNTLARACAPARACVFNPCALVETMPGRRIRTWTTFRPGSSCPQPPRKDKSRFVF